MKGITDYTIQEVENKINDLLEQENSLKKERIIINISLDKMRKKIELWEGIKINKYKIFLKTPRQIKTLVNNVSDVDIGLNKRDRKISDLRAVYYALCRIFTEKYSQREIVNEVGLISHSTMISGLKKFDLFRDQKHYKSNLKIYNICFIILGISQTDLCRNMEVKFEIV